MESQQFWWSAPLRLLSWEECKGKRRVLRCPAAGQVPEAHKARAKREAEVKLLNIRNRARWPCHPLGESEIPKEFRDTPVRKSPREDPAPDSIWWV